MKMKQIKHLVMAFAAVCLTAGLSSCEKEKEVIKEVPVEKIVEKEVEKIVEKTDTVTIIDESNWAKYQSIVTGDVISHKNHDKVILLVAFGSTWDQAYDAFDTTIDAYKAAFGDYDAILQPSVSTVQLPVRTQSRVITMLLLSGSMPLLLRACSMTRSWFSRCR